MSVSSLDLDLEPLDGLEKSVEYQLSLLLGVGQHQLLGKGTSLLSNEEIEVREVIKGLLLCLGLDHVLESLSNLSEFEGEGVVAFVLDVDNRQTRLCGRVVASVADFNRTQYLRHCFCFGLILIKIWANKLNEFGLTLFHRLKALK